MLPLRQLQKRFAQALLDRDRDPPEGLAGRRFAIHRNNSYVALTDPLEARFPVCRALVGEAFFRALARVFVEMSPPRSPVLMTWGDDLPVFLELFPPARPVPYLADVARLEIAWSQAYHAAEAEPLDAADLARVPPNAWDRARVRLHPSVRTVASAYAIVSIWAAHQDAPATPGASEAEDALVARPGWTVGVTALPPGGATFVDAVRRHGDIPSAAREAAASAPGLDLTKCLSTVIRA